MLLHCEPTAAMDSASAFSVPSAWHALLPLTQLSLQKAFYHLQCGWSVLNWAPTALLLTHDTQASPRTGHHPQLVSLDIVPSVEICALEFPELSAPLWAKCCSAH